ncbi:2-dehydropantoate 2-reductase [Acidisoma cellulosilytica]|uniref:2-dehydropantoate 2-reductase n=1 Tax=Acidisoma cellulosilyticum TaxID=2802395 RepID=A0A964E5C7_9PROT|nr:2-dehydropantoate 2-reductase [Acidisoma cellulosilyticum]MCB8882570.1 2-dehydropantoate 2-reductase [Acidisoma cellulosilyticum]
MKEDPRETILIWGAGAIGGTIGAYLVRAGEDVLFVDSAADHVAAMNKDGLTIEGPIEQFSVPVRAALPQNVVGRFSCILLCVKAHHTEAASLALLPHLAEGGYVASFQNGLNEFVIGDVIGISQVIGAFINFGADYLSPGLILYGGRGACVLGEIDGSRTPRVEALHHLLTLFEPGAIVTDDILGYLWGKLGYGALLFATAVTDDSIADVLAMEAHRPVLAATARETMAVATAKGIRPRGFNGFDPLAFAPCGAAGAVDASMAEMVAHNRRSAKSHSGIWRDLAVRRRKTEVDAQLGPILVEGAALGIATPVTARLVAMIHEIEDGGRVLERANLEILAQSMAEGA